MQKPEVNICVGGSVDYVAITRLVSLPADVSVLARHLFLH
jgi:hypothetical protein